MNQEEYCLLKNGQVWFTVFNILRLLFNLEQKWWWWNLVWFDLPDLGMQMGQPSDQLLHYSGEVGLDQLKIL